MRDESGNENVQNEAAAPGGTAPAGTFRLSLLGSFSLSDPAGQAVEVTSRKNRLLLAMLALAPGRSISRDTLAGVLWSESGEDQAKSSLRQALAVLRKDLKGQDGAFFAGLDSTIALHHDRIAIDTDFFLRDAGLHTREQLERAIGLWRGPFLADVTAPEPGLEQWLSEQREHFGSRHIAAMDRLVPLLDGAARIDLARRLVQADSLREESHRQLMEAYSLAGERSQALRHYDKVRKLLKEELGVAPSPEIEELRKRLAANGNNGHGGQGAADSMPPAAPVTPVPASDTAPHAPDAPPALPVTVIQKDRSSRRPALAAILALVLIVAAGAGWYFTRKAPEAPSKPFIAILPFDSLSGSAEDARIADALTVDTITDLSRYADIRVMARDTTDPYKGSTEKIRKLNEDLNVSYALKGTFQRESGKVRITAQLLDTATGAVLWSDRYDRPAGEIFAIQSDVADHIANSVGGRAGSLGENILARAKRKPPSDLGAYEMYLLAQATMHSDLSPEHFREGQQLLLRAIDKDPTFARAYIKYAHALAWRVTYEKNASNLIQEMIKYTRKGVELDPTDSEAHAALGYALTLSGDLAQGEAQFDEALRLNPNSFDILMPYACMAHNYGKPERGAEATDRAIVINPNYPNWAIPCLRLGVFMVGRYEDALRIQSRQPEDEMNTDGFVVKAGSLAALDKTAEAKAVAQRGIAKYPGLLSIERFAFNRGWSPASAKVIADHMRKAGFPTCAADQDLADTPNAVRLPECTG